MKMLFSCVGYQLIKYILELFSVLVRNPSLARRYAKTYRAKTILLLSIYIKISKSIWMNLHIGKYLYILRKESHALTKWCWEFNKYLTKVVARRKRLEI